MMVSVLEVQLEYGKLIGLTSIFDDTPLIYFSDER